MRRPLPWFNWLALIVVVVSASVAWSKRIGGGDTFVSLAAGRDALAGKIGLPDEWSFTTEGRIWLNQNWGSHTTYYVSHRLLGDTGPVLIKWLVIFGMMLLMIRAAVHRGTHFCLAAGVVAVAILVGRSYLDVRPHIFTLLFEAALIVVFYRWYKGSAAWAFVATAIIGLWSNMHGGFIFGIAIMGLWMGVQGFLKLIAPRTRPWGWSHLGVFAVALGIAIVLAAVANPFGPVNLTHPLVVEKSEVWLSVQEWHPILDWEALVTEFSFKQATGFGSVTEFLVLMGLLIVTLIVWGVARVMRVSDEDDAAHAPASLDTRRESRRRKQKQKRKKTEPAAPSSDWLVQTGLFDFALMLVVIMMAFKARRFIPLATVVVAPMLATLLDDMLTRIKRVILHAADAPLWTRSWLHALSGVHVALLIVGLFFVWQEILIPYQAHNPYYPKQTVLMRMVGSQTFPKRAIDFLELQMKAQELPEETFVDWRWEGYTRWRTDELKTFCGGRAQQVHSEEVAKWQITTPSPHTGGKRLRVGRIKGGLIVNNERILALVGRYPGVVAEMGSGRVPMGHIKAAIEVQEKDGTVLYEADKTQEWQWIEHTEYWADLSITVERTTEPTFRAKYRLVIMGDQPWYSHGCGFFGLQLVRLTNTSDKVLDVQRHLLLLDSIYKGQQKALGKSPIVFWQAKDLRYGFAVSSSLGGMTPRITTAGGKPRLVSAGVANKRLKPGEAFIPERAATLAFVHHCEVNTQPAGTLRTIHFMESVRNCRKVVTQATRENGILGKYHINIFILPHKDWRLIWLLMGSKRWALVFDDGTAAVLVNRTDPRNEKLVQRILKGEAEYPSEFLKALGMALTRWSVSAVGSNIENFEKDLKEALRIQPNFCAYWWLSQTSIMSPRAGTPKELKEEIPYWLEQWEIVNEGPVDPDLELNTYRARQLIAHQLRKSYGKTGQNEEAAKWSARFEELSQKMHAIREKYM